MVLGGAMQPLVAQPVWSTHMYKHTYIVVVVVVVVVVVRMMRMCLLTTLSRGLPRRPAS